MSQLACAYESQIKYTGLYLLSAKVNEWCPIHWLHRFLFHQPHNRSTVRYYHIIRLAECGIEIYCHLLTSLIF